MTTDEIKNHYELETGHVIVETFKNIDPMAVPGVLVHGHGPFNWGKDPLEAVHNAVVMEEVAKLAFRTIVLNPDIRVLDQNLQDKHYFRKHGENAYYGQG